MGVSLPPIKAYLFPIGRGITEARARSGEIGLWWVAGERTWKKGMERSYGVAAVVGRGITNNNQEVVEYKVTCTISGI